MAFLVATTVEIDGSSARIDYPTGSLFRPSFSPESLSTYQGSVEIRLRDIGKKTAQPPISVRYQACDETRCLPPSTTRLAFPGSTHE